MLPLVALGLLRFVAPALLRRLGMTVAANVVRRAAPWVARGMLAKRLFGRNSENGEGPTGDTAEKVAGESLTGAKKKIPLVQKFKGILRKRPSILESATQSLESNQKTFSVVKESADSTGPSLTNIEKQLFNIATIVTSLVDLKRKGFGDEQSLSQDSTRLADTEDDFATSFSQTVNNLVTSINRIISHVNNKAPSGNTFENNPENLVTPLGAGSPGAQPGGSEGGSSGIAKLIAGVAGLAIGASAIGETFGPNDSGGEDRTPSTSNKGSSGSTQAPPDTANEEGGTNNDTSEQASSSGSDDSTAPVESSTSPDMVPGDSDVATMSDNGEQTPASGNTDTSDMSTGDSDASLVGNTDTSDMSTGDSDASLVGNTDTSDMSTGDTSKQSVDITPRDPGEQPTQVISPGVEGPNDVTPVSTPNLSMLGDTSAAEESADDTLRQPEIQSGSLFDMASIFSPTNQNETPAEDLYSMVGSDTAIGNMINELSQYIEITEMSAQQPVVIVNSSQQPSPIIPSGPTGSRGTSHVPAVHYNITPGIFEQLYFVGTT